MLNRAVFENYHSVARELAQLVATNQKDENESENHAFCQLFETKGAFHENRNRTEAFGPTSIIVRCGEPEEFLKSHGPWKEA